MVRAGMEAVVGAHRGAASRKKSSSVRPAGFQVSGRVTALRTDGSAAFAISSRAIAQPIIAGTRLAIHRHGPLRRLRNLAYRIGRKLNHLAALLRRTPESPLSKPVWYVELDYFCHDRYHSHPHSHRIRPPSLAFLRTRRHTAQQRIHITSSPSSGRTLSNVSI